jgi:hypothetical protein
VVGGRILHIEQVVQNLPDIAHTATCIAVADVQDNNASGMYLRLWLDRKRKPISAR